jgi:hypothetical protein
VSESPATAQPNRLDRPVVSRDVLSVALLLALLAGAWWYFSGTATVYLENRSMGRARFYVDDVQACDAQGSSQCAVTLSVWKPHVLSAVTDYGLSSYATPTANLYLQRNAQYEYISCGMTGTPQRDCGLFSRQGTSPGGGAPRSTETRGAVQPTASAPVLPAPAPAPPPTYDTSGPQTSSGYVEAPAPTSEAIDELNTIKLSEWTYYQQTGTFTRNLRYLGLTLPVGSHYYYSIPQVNQSQVIIIATGKFLTPESGLRLALVLKADGAAQIVRYR